MTSYYKVFTAKAPVNIAVIKYWGKSDERLKIPLNDSLSGTLSLDDMCATTSVAISDKFTTDQLWLNGSQQELNEESHAKILLNSIRAKSQLHERVLNYKVHIVSFNNFPTAAGLASSAAGYACLAYVLGNAYGITDPTELSILARQGSGSACRSLFGGFVQWVKGHDDPSSKAIQVVDHLHWPNMRVVICVANDSQKDVSSTRGMMRSTKTSPLLKLRAELVVPGRIDAIKEAIVKKDFQTFSELTMRDSNQFHAICLDTYPPLFYLNDASRQIIRLCSMINSHYGINKVAYTFDAGPNACIYLMNDFVDQFITIIKYFFPVKNDGVEGVLKVIGSSHSSISPNDENLKAIIEILQTGGIIKNCNSISYLISTSIGVGPKMTEEHLTDNQLKP